jgi:hypothetical protein
MTDIKRMSLVKPGLTTPFHIDFEWWKEMDQNWRIDLRGLLCAEHQEALNAFPEDQMIDWVDPETAEVKQMDGLQLIVSTHCAAQADFVTDHTTLVDSVFRTLMSNGNKPMSADELGKYLGRSPETLLRTLAGPRVYKGIRPFLNN